MSSVETLHLIAFLSFICIVNAQFERCDFLKRILSAGQSVTVNYPGSNAAGTSCRYQVVAPVGTIIEASCSFSIPSCSTQKIFASRSGDKETRDASSHCGRGSILQRSIGNEFVVALRSSKAGASSFNCVFKSIMLTDSYCDCGWNVRTKIVGGATAGVNEFVSHAGLVNKLTRDVFCGAILITQKNAISASHCFDAYPNVATTALLVGDHDLSTGAETIWSVAYLLQSYKKHIGYNADTMSTTLLS